MHILRSLEYRPNENVLERDIHKLLDWFKNGGEINQIWCILLKNKKAIAGDFDIIVDDTKLNLTNDMTVLDIKMNSHLNFTMHVSNMCNKAGRQLNSYKA